MAEAAGAVLAHMDQANICPAMPTRYDGKPHGIPLLFHAEPHAILVDHQGRRLVSKLDFNIGEALNLATLRRGSRCICPSGCSLATASGASRRPFTGMPEKSAAG